MRQHPLIRLDDVLKPAMFAREMILLAYVR